MESEVGVWHIVKCDSSKFEKSLDNLLGLLFRVTAAGRELLHILSMGRHGRRLRGRSIMETDPFMSVLSKAEKATMRGGH